ncbi:hypothetical protein DFH06DRAFT_1144267 [Mycena polygramma]|nr:hypothetical protein DFH06DRAFT_1144267 [Mycena polygramma]
MSQQRAFNSLGSLFHLTFLSASGSSYQPPPPAPLPPPLYVPPPLGLLAPSLSNPIRTFPGVISAAASASSNDNRNAAIARHFPKKYKAPRSFPVSSAPAPSFQVLVALWPNLIPGSPFDVSGVATLDIAYTVDQFSEMLITLKEHHLAFVATLPSGDQSDIVEELSMQLSAHLAANGLHLPASSTDPSSTLWFHRPWMVLENSRRRAVYTFSQHSRANANNFNRKMILDMNSKFVNPDIEHSGLPLLPLAPRFEHVRGALPSTLSREALEDAYHLEKLHSCLGQRILYGLPHSGRERDVACHPGLCPSEDQPPPVSRPTQRRERRERTPSAMVASTSRIRDRSPPTRFKHQLTRSQAVVMPALASPSDTDDDEFATPSLLPVRRANPVRSTRLPIPVPPPTQLQLATGEDISAWQRKIWIDVTDIPESHTVRIQGDNITAMAQFIIDVFYHLSSRQLNSSSSSVFPTPAAIRDPRTQMTSLSFLQHEVHRSYFIGRGPGGSLGRGVEQAVWRNILSLLAGDTQFWRPAMVESEHVTFVLSPVSTTERAARFHAYGQLAAINLYYYGQGLSIGLWPMLAIALGRQSMLLGYPFLRLISPDVAVELRPWFALRVTDPIPTAMSDPVCGLIMDTLDIQPSLIPSVRTQAQHDDVTVKIVSRKLLGYEQPWSEPDFLTLQDGFDVSLSDDVTFAHHFRTLTPLGAALLISGMYRRQIRSLPDVLDHLHFVVLASVTAPPEVALMRTLFELRFKRYLAGRGHPQWLRTHGLIDTDAEMERGSSLPFLRAELLLLTALESSLLPVKDTWRIRPPPNGNIALHQTQSLPLQFHTCSGGVDVRVNPKLYDLLIRSPRGDENTEFDVYIHTQLYNADLAYNTV